jgi:hypothetical protein
MKNQQTKLKIKRGKSEIKMKKLLFVNVAEGKFCNKIMFNLFVVNFKLHFLMNIEYIVALLLSPFPFFFKILQISISFLFLNLRGKSSWKLDGKI